jgi:RHS repeat-associated protein
LTSRAVSSSAIPRASGLYHYGARYYNPTTARFTRQDPLNQVDDLRQANRYAYAGGDPINLSDRAGTSILGVLRGCIEGAVAGPTLPGVSIYKTVRGILVKIPVAQSRGALAAAGCIEGGLKGFL